MDETVQIAGRWNYESFLEPIQYGETESYRLAAAWLNGCSEVEDWGCGCAFAKRFFTTQYIGIDGSKSLWNDKVADLMIYRSKTEGLHIRHVLEHNYLWRPILRNALDSFTKRMVLTLFIRPTPTDMDVFGTVQNHYFQEVPNRGLCKKDLMEMIGSFLVETHELDTGEVVYLLEKKIDGS